MSRVEKLDKGTNHEDVHLLKENKNIEPVDEFHAYKTSNKVNYLLLKIYALENRQNMTQAEKLLWERLKVRTGGDVFRRQHIISDYIADFICIKKKLVIEVDGKYHNLPEQMISDEERTAHLQTLGYKVIRFTNDEIYAHLDDVLKRIYESIN